MTLEEALSLGWTEEQYYESGKNHDIVTKKLKVPKGYVLHHIDPSWKKEDPERYIKWNLEDLELMTKSQHLKLHNSGNKNPMYGKKRPEVGKRNSELKKGKPNLGVKQYWENFRNKGLSLSEETKQKISLAQTGRKHTEESKQKISETKKGSKHSEETKLKISKTKKEKLITMTEEERKEKFGHNKGKEPVNKGKKASEETKQKLRKAWKRRKGLVSGLE
jgi:hypothetical protein